MSFAGQKRKHPASSREAAYDDDAAEGFEEASTGGSLSAADEVNLRILSNMPQLKNYRPDKRGRRGGVYLGHPTDTDYIDAIADAMGANSQLPESVLLSFQTMDDPDTTGKAPRKPRGLLDNKQADRKAQEGAAQVPTADSTTSTASSEDDSSSSEESSEDSSSSESSSTGSRESDAVQATKGDDNASVASL